MATKEELSECYLSISRRYLRQAEEELHQKGDTLQASEKIWGAAALALKSVAALRGWNHKSHPLLGDIAMQLRVGVWKHPVIPLVQLSGKYPQQLLRASLG